MGWFRKSKSKEELLLERVDPRVLIGTAYPSAIARVKDLERVGKSDEAQQLFDAVMLAVSGLSNYPDGLGVMLNALGEAASRRRHDMVSLLEAAIRKSPRMVGSERPALLAGLDEVLAVARDGDGSGAMVFYVCQRCGKITLHASEPCPNCLFLPTSIEEAYRSVRLSSTSVGAFRLPGLGSRIRTAGFEQVEELLESNVPTRQKDPRYMEAVEVIFEICSRRNVAEYQPLDTTATCTSCGTRSLVAWWARNCQECGSAKVILPPAKLYKMVVRDSLVWLQDIPEPGANHHYARLVYELAQLQELAAFQGKFVTREEGYPIKRNMDQIGKLRSRDGRFEIEFDPQGVRGRHLTSDGAAANVVDNVATSGPELFNRLAEFLYQGVALA